MSLREKLLFRSKVAALPCIDMQPRNSPLNNATTYETPTQQPASKADDMGVTNATVDATSLQLHSCARVENTLQKVALNCNQYHSDASVLVSEVTLLERLLDAAERCCDYWNDGAAARAEMIADVKATPQHLRQDLLDHFISTYGKAK